MKTPSDQAKRVGTQLSQGLDPKYLRDKGVVAVFGISRSKLYQLAKDGRIKSISLQEEGMSRGTRLFCVESIEKYIESFA